MRALVVDDSSLFRRVMADVLAGLPAVEVVGQAANGKLALEKIAALKPDLITLDLEMPELDGLGVLDALRGQADAPAVIVISAATQNGGRLTMQALQKGAFDFVPKPDSGNMAASREALAAELAHRVKALSLRLSVRRTMQSARQPVPAPPAATVTATPRPSRIPRPAVPHAGSPSVAQRMQRLAQPGRLEFLLIGVSTGGPNALAELLPGLPGDLAVPTLIVQHMPPVFTRSLAESLNAKCALTVCEAGDGDVPRPGHVYIAPGGRHMRLASGPDGAFRLQITDDPAENNCRPAVDYLFRSVAQLAPGKSLAVILTGMGADGTEGVRVLKAGGTLALAQDEASCVVYGMPRALVDAGLADAVVPLSGMAERIATTLMGVHA